MSLTSRITRLFNTSAIFFNSEKSLLATLRKQTGYTFASCRQALQLHNNDLDAAEKWLQEQAREMGWKKATKLEGRQTTQGLVGVLVKDSFGALVEVNCETDFVARNNEFRNLVEEVTHACLDFTRKQQLPGEFVTKICLSTEQISPLESRDGTSLADLVALKIGTLGENATLKRAQCFKIPKDIRIYGYAHPSESTQNDILLGRLAGVVLLKQVADKDIDLNFVGKNLCQHIVGMNPKRIGTEEDIPNKLKDEEECLIHQEYLLDDTVTVKEILEEYGVEVVDFKRFQCGQQLFDKQRQPLNFVETCQ